MTVLLVLLDAARSEYLDSGRMKLLKRRLSKGNLISPSEASFGFCERTEIVAGLNSARSGFTFAIDRADKPNGSFHGWIVLLLRFCCWFLRGIGLSGSIVDRLARSVVERKRRWTGVGVKPYGIPLRTYANYYYTEDAFDHATPGIFGSSSIYDVARKCGRVDDAAFTAVGKTSSLITDEDRMSYVLKVLKDDQDYSLITLYINQLDILGHQFGPDSKEMTVVLEDFDKLFDSFLSEVCKENDSVTVVVVGDHGMESVSQTVDVGAIILAEAAKLRLKFGKDYDYFLDSTVVRVWSFTNAGDALIGELDSLFNSADFAEALRPIDSVAMRNTTATRGWFCNGGYMIFPCFFHQSKPYLGMHGYDPTRYNSKGFIGVIGEGRTLSLGGAAGKLTDAYTVICKLLEQKK